MLFVIIRKLKGVFAPMVRDRSRKRARAMPYYRVYILDERGDVEGAVDLDCIDDEAAKERTKLVLGGHFGELWRLVIVSDPNDPWMKPKLQ